LNALLVRFSRGYGMPAAPASVNPPASLLQWFGVRRQDVSADRASGAIAARTSSTANRCEGLIRSFVQCL
jgi:hypothetical protein